MWQDPELCPPEYNLTPSTEFPGAALRNCSAQTAAADALLPPISTLLSTLRQLSTFYKLLRVADLNSMPGTDLTVLAPENAAFDAALQARDLTQQQLDDPQAANALLLSSIVSGALRASTLGALGTVNSANNETLMAQVDPEGAYKMPRGFPVCFVFARRAQNYPIYRCNCSMQARSGCKEV